MKLTSRQRQVMRRIDRGPYHMLPSSALEGHARGIALKLSTFCLVALLPPKGRFPQRWVVTAQGSDALGVFDSIADLDAEIAALRTKGAA